MTPTADRPDPATPTARLRAAFAAAWRRRASVLIAHAAALALRAAVVAPLAALTVQGAIMLSGQPALSDYAIARYLASPLGVAAAVLAGGATVALLTLELGVMIALARRAPGVGLVWAALRRAPAVFVLGMMVTGRALLLAAPFVAVGGVGAWLLLDGRDVYYHLSERTPAWFALLALGAVLALGLGATLAAGLARWALALPVMIAEGAAPRAALAQSARMTEGRRGAIALDLALWGGGSALLGVGAAALVGASAAALAPGQQAGVGTAALYLGVALTLWYALNAVVAALSVATLAMLLDGWMARLGGAAPRPVAPPAPLSTGRRVAAAAALAAVALTGAAAAGATLAARAGGQDAVRVIAHRGAGALRPENTLAAFEKAIEDGADWIELDVQETADGAVIVMHDADFLRVGGVDLRVSDAALADVARIDVGGRFDPAYADQRAPTLAQALALANGRAQVLIELKHYGRAVRLEQRVAEVVEAAGMADAVAVMSLDHDAVARMQALRPGWRSGLLAAAAVGDLTRSAGDFLAVNAATATPAFIRHATARDRPVLVWTVNDPLAASRLISRGAAGLITDDPAMARAVLADRAAMGAAQRLMLDAAALLGLTPRAAAP